MITLDEAREIWRGIDENSYTEQEIYDRVDDYCWEATRYYETDEGLFTAVGTITYPDTFDAEEVRFEGKNGESYNFRV